MTHSAAPFRNMQPHPESNLNFQLPTPQRCGLLRWGMIMIYDALVVIVLLMVATAVAMLWQMGNPVAGKDMLFSFYLAVVWFLYLAWCWRHGGMTLGMRAWRVRLVAESGEPVSWKLCVLRFAGGLLSALPLGLGYFWSVVDRDGLAWHDRLSQSRLVRS